MKALPALTGQERHFDANEVIVSKTDLKGKITYANQVFLRLSGYTEQEILGAPHNLIRHPDMPRCVFKLLWDTIAAGKEIFAYVVNRSKNGDHYWVLAHVTPSYDANGRIIGYHSNRRVPRREPLDSVIIPTYRALCQVEKQNPNPRDGMAASLDVIVNMLKEKGTTYDEWILSL